MIRSLGLGLLLFRLAPVSSCWDSTEPRRTLSLCVRAVGIVAVDLLWNWLGNPALSSNCSPSAPCFASWLLPCYSLVAYFALIVPGSPPLRSHFGSSIWARSFLLGVCEFMQSTGSAGAKSSASEPRWHSGKQQTRQAARMILRLASLLGVV